MWVVIGQQVNPCSTPSPVHTIRIIVVPRHLESTHNGIFGMDVTPRGQGQAGRFPLSGARSWCCSPCDPKNNIFLSYVYVLMFRRNLPQIPAPVHHARVCNSYFPQDTSPHFRVCGIRMVFTSTWAETTPLYTYCCCL